ncbi:fused MFS/spermidine synthase [Geoalkalibacter halelectricus]|uniref:fused MFS/spermidine synthase n=1 Tax=Geoalkalibacter halelectricus TaxID=2847045 RepID=UPI002670BAD3|nr:fused MFS/spermidine synthase [Geoalkalibacter halelectricus]MDO3378750.1 fused MFS/spermidine synthase [Geoalkalibacter halelectricus]
MEPRPCQKAVIYLIFVLSGFCALVFEVLWSKYLALTFGTTIGAVSIVTATFMAGLALGSYIFGRYTVDHDANPLRLYAWLEVGVAVTALLFAPTLVMVERIYVFWTHILPQAPWLTTSVNILFCAMLLLPPTIFMGGTLPVMCRLFARRKCGGQIGRLYALNTLGATLGAFAAAFMLIPALGLSRTGYLAVALNLAIAGGAFILSRRCAAAPGEKPATPRHRDWFPDPRTHRPVLIAVGLVGFFTLAYQILWTRVLMLFLGNTVYAFALMLSTYLVGVALGAALYARLVHPALNERRLFCLLTLLIGLVVLASAPFYDQLALVFQFAHDASGDRWWHLSLLSYLIVFAVLGLPTLLSGALIPAAFAILDPGQRHTGEGIGLVVLHDTLGSVLGALAAGFVLLPLLGPLDSFRLLAVANLILGVWLFYHFRLDRPLARLLPITAAVLAAVLFLPLQWDAKLMNSGVYVYAPKYRALGGMQVAMADENILDVIKGRDATVAVFESADGRMRFFTVNGKTDGGTGLDRHTQTLIGHLPLFAHPEPREVLVIGLGTGITLQGLSAHPTERIDCVEISREVVRAEQYFREANDNVLADPKVRLLVQDGRNLLLTRDQSYDVIVSQPSNPWQSGNANLFTLEFYRLAAEHLREGGIFGQWLGLYDITPDNLRLAVRTLMEVFPEVQVFHSGADLILIASQQPVEFDYQAMARRFAQPTLAAVMQAVDLASPGELIAGHYLYDGPSLRTFAGMGPPFNSDDRPVLEHASRHNLGQNTLGEFQQANMQALLAARGHSWLPLTNLGTGPRQFAAALRDLGDGYARVGMSAEARNFYQRAAEVERELLTEGRGG